MPNFLGGAAIYISDRKSDWIIGKENRYQIEKLVTTDFEW